MTDYDVLLLEIETARGRHAWASDELTRGRTPALIAYEHAALNELHALRTVLQHSEAGKHSHPLESSLL